MYHYHHHHEQILCSALFCVLIMIPGHILMKTRPQENYTWLWTLADVATSVTAVERGHHWSMFMDMNIDERLGWQRFRVQYCEIGRYDKNPSFIIMSDNS